MVDVFNHCLPREFVDAVNRGASTVPLMFERATAIPGMTDLDARLRHIGQFSGYHQVLSLASPAVESLGDPNRSPDLATIGNDAQARWCAGHPDRFVGFIASLPMNNPAAALAEAARAVNELGALGVQVYTHVNGAPLDRPETLPLFELMAMLDLPVWLHPLRASTVADYPGEAVSRYDLWWALGWPHETGVAMGRLVFAGIFDKWPGLKIITHHAGGTIPMMEGRLDAGLALLGTRYPPEHSDAAQTPLKEKPVDAFRRFYADTATFGASAPVKCGAAFFGDDKMLFASDYPFAGIGESLVAVEGMEGALENNWKRLFPTDA